MVVYNIEPFGSFARIGNRNEVCAKVSGSNFGGICEQIRSIFSQRRRPNFGGLSTRTRMRVLFYMVICASVFAENWGRFHSPLVPLACFSMCRLPKHFCAFGATSALADAFLCLLLPNDIRVLFHEKALFLRFLSLLPLLYLALFRRETSGRRPREQRHNSPPTKSAVC